MRRLAALLLLSDANFAHTMAARDRGETDAGILFGSGLTMWITVQASKFELFINLKTAKTLGIPIPQALLALADTVIE